MVKLGDIFDFKNGRAFKKEEWNLVGLPIVRIQNLNDFKATYNYFNGEYDKAIEINEGDLLFSWSGTVGTSFGPHLWSRERGLLNQHIYKLNFNKNIIKEYAYYALLAITKEIEKSVNGAVGLVHVTKKSLNEFRIPLPSIQKQQKIVAKLDAIFAEIETATVAAEANVNNAEALFQSFLENLFLRISEANKPLKLSNFIKLEYGKGLEDSDRELNGIYGAYGANGIKSKTNKFLYDKPSIVVGRKGSAGELTLVEEKFWALDVTYYVTHDFKKTDLTFLYYALKMLNIPSLAKGIKPGINRNDVYDLTIAVPILSEQKLLVEKILFVNKNLEIAKNLYKSKCNELTLLKQSILHRAFNSELVKD